MLVTDQILLDTLKNAYKLIEDPQHWTQYTWARNADGQPVNPHNPTACKWCLLGALSKSAALTLRDITGNLDPRLEQLAKQLKNTFLEVEIRGPLDAINDLGSHDTVLIDLNKVITHVEQRIHAT